MSRRWKESSDSSDSLLLKEEGRNSLPAVAGILSALAVFLVFLPVIFARFGIYDSLRMALDFGWTGESRMMGVMLGGGRFLYALFAKVGFGSVEVISDLWYLRLFGVLSLMLCAYSVTVYACRVGWGCLAATGAGVLVVMNPGVAVYGFWSACFPYGLGMLAAFHGGILWERRGARSKWLSIFLMQIALMIYQPTALFFFVGPLLSWFADRDKPASPLKAVWCAAGMLLGLVFHVLLLKVLLSIFSTLPAQSERLVDAGSLAAIPGVVVSVLPRIFYSWGDLLPGGIPLGLAAIFLVGWFLFFFESRNKDELILKLVTMLPLSMSLIPALISANGYAPYRLLAPVYAAIGLVTLAGYAHAFTVKNPLRYVSIGGTVVVILIAGSYTIQYGIVKPRVMEMTVLEQALEEVSPSGSLNGMTLIRPNGTYPIDQHIYQKAEYGSYELSYPGFSESFMALIAAETYDWEKEDGNPINRIHWVFCASTTEAVPAFYPVVDLRAHLQGLQPAPLATSQGASVHHPILGDVLYFPPSLYLSPHLGITQQEADDWFFLPGEGWMQWESEPGERPLEALATDGRILNFASP